MAGEFTVTYKTETELMKDTKNASLIDSCHTVQPETFKISRKEINMETKFKIKTWGVIVLLFSLLIVPAGGNGVRALKSLTSKASI